MALPVPNKLLVVGAVPPDAPLPKIPPVYPPAPPPAPKRPPYFDGSVALLDPPKIAPVFGEVEELLPNNEPEAGYPGPPAGFAPNNPPEEPGFDWGLVLLAPKRLPLAAGWPELAPNRPPAPVLPDVL